MPKSVSIRLDLKSGPDYRFVLPAKRAEAVKGDDATYQVDVDFMGGYSETVAPSLGHITEGVSYDYDPSSFVEDGTATLTIDTTNLAAGVHYPTVEPAAPGGYDWLLVDNADRIIDWSKAGVWYNDAKGIPDFPVGVVCESPAYSVYPNQATNSRAGIQAAINSCPSGKAVLLPAGTYQVGGVINLKSGVVLRGAGPGQTILEATNSSAGFLAEGDSEQESVIDAIGAGPDANNVSGPLTSGYTKGSYSVVVQHAAVAANISVGQQVLINELNDPNEIVSEAGYEGDCDWAFGSGKRGLGEWKIVESKNGTTLTFKRPLYFDYKSSLNPKIIRYFSTNVTNAGVEDLTFDGKSKSAQCYKFRGAIHCWAKGCEFKGWTQYGINLTNGSVGNSVTHCYLHDPSGFGSDQGYGMNIDYCATDNLVCDNIGKWTKNLCTIGSGGGTANVVAYNYSHSTNHWQEWWSKNAFGLHGVHTLLNLFDGNVGGQMMSDGAWGSNSRTVAFRNHFSGKTNNPDVTMHKICVEVEALSYRHSFIGNVLGFSGMSGQYEPIPYSDDEDYCIWKIGFVGADEGRPTDNFTVSSTLRHGNYDYITNSTVWDPSISGRGIPPSLYLNSKPAWFGSLAWPAIGPDVIGYVEDIPAQARWKAHQASGNLGDLF